MRSGQNHFGWKLAIILLMSVLGFWAPVANAQIEFVGSEATLDVATWNIEWFGSPSNGPLDDDVQVQNVADIMLGSGIDLWAVQEIASTTRADELEGLLPDYWDKILAVSGQQRIGYYYDSRVLSLRSSTHILQSFNSAFATRPPLKAEFLVQLPDTSFILTVINVHMKAFADADSYAKRVEAATRVKNHIDFTDLALQPVLFMGDFNDELEQSTYAGQPSPYAPFVNDPEDYTMLTLPIEQAGISSYLGGSTIDHIVATNEMADLWVSGSTRVLTRLVTVNGYGGRTSDHLPVVASFGRPVGTSIELERTLPDPAVSIALYPNPVSDRLHVTWEAGHPGASYQWDIVDLLGRIVSSANTTETEFTIDVDGLSSGLYLLRTQKGSQATTKTFMVW